MKIKVPTIKQKYKTGCGAAAMSMIYRYFGKNISEKEIVKGVGGLTKLGSFTTDHALMARKLGFKVICYSYNLEYFDPSYKNLSRTDFIKKTKSLATKEKRIYNKRELKSILNILKSDIKFKMVIPSLNTIRGFLNKKMPVCVAVNAAILFEKKKDLRIGHFVVLTGYEEEKFYYNDPASGEKRSILADKLIFALSNNVFDSSASLRALEK